MRIKAYHKLVRDRIPEIIASDGKTCVCETLADEAYLRLLDAKLTEELSEYQESRSLEELADLLEVLRAVVKARGWTWGQLEQIRQEKATKRGGFEKKIFLKEVHLSSDYQGLISEILRNQAAIIKKITPQMLNTYHWLQDNLRQRNIAVDEEYRKKFVGYYRMRFVSQPYRDRFFSLFETIKNDTELSFANTARELFQVDGKHEFSFISKMLHTIDPNRPIYDNQVALALRLHQAYRRNLEDKLRQDEMILRQIAEAYRHLEASAEMANILAAFDQIVPERSMSMAKKLDFLLWALGGIKKRKSTAHFVS